MSENVLSRYSVAERVGFEPTDPFGPTVFKTAPLNLSGISPVIQFIFNFFQKSIPKILVAIISKRVSIADFFLKPFEHVDGVLL